MRISIEHVARFRIGASLLAGLCVTNVIAAEKAASACDRSCLEGFIDRYLDAVVAHDPAQAPLAQPVKFTENGQRLSVGDGLWNTASARGPYKLYVTDPEALQVGFFGTIRENGTPAILALRLKLVNQEIAEIETLVARDEKETLKLEAMGAPHPALTATVPRAERSTRAELVKIADMYFAGLERNNGKGAYPFTDDCNRIENGQQTTNRPSENPGPFDVSALGCKAQFETGFFRFVTRIRDRRFVVIDEERQLSLAFVFFDHAGDVPAVTLTDGRTIPIGVSRPWTWEIAELFKIENKLIRQIQAVIRESAYGMNSGWSTWEEGLSSDARR
jgi:hypothetical protein